MPRLCQPSFWGATVCPEGQAVLQAGKKHGLPRTDKPWHPAVPHFVSGTFTMQTSSDSNSIADVQGYEDGRHVAIDKVGVKNIIYPMILKTRDGKTQDTIAKINMYVSLPHHQKGTHMSRFLEVLNDHRSEPLTPDRIPEVTAAIRERLNAETAHFEASFTYFMCKPAPVTGMRGLMDYEVTFACEVNGSPETSSFVIGVAVPATSLCPCSKEISEYGAHNQRCRISAKVKFDGTLWIEDLVEVLEGAASSPVYAVLKRPDEKFVTEAAYDNPKFVEDIIRDLALALDKDERIKWYEIDSENFESIHSHNAYAQITRSRG